LARTRAHLLLGGRAPRGRERLHGTDRAICLTPICSDPARPAAGEPVFNIGYDVYKGSGALQARPIFPLLERSTTQSGREITKLQRKGVLLFEAASGSNRTYDWSSKIRLAIDVTEMSRIFLSNELTKDRAIQIVHDPNMQSANQGQVWSAVGLHFMLNRCH
jgi:Whirly transcription factor